MKCKVTDGCITLTIKIKYQVGLLLNTTHELLAENSITSNS